MTVRILAVCPNCENSTFIYKDGGFECLACGDIVYPEDLTIIPVEIHELSEYGLEEKSN